MEDSRLTRADEPQPKTDLATDETRMKHGFDFVDSPCLGHVRVSSVFHPWLKIVRACRQEIATEWNSDAAPLATRGLTRLGA
jgi:hypothetical protein